MKKILILIFLFSSFFELRATHVLGGDIQWTCMNNDTYLIKVTIYRRCTDGTPFMNDAGLNIMTGKSSYSGLSLVSWVKSDITPVCNLSYFPCPIAGGSAQSSALIPVGIEKNEFTYKVKFTDTTICAYKVLWQLCCRNSNISTGYADMDFIIDADINRCVKDNSPIFSSEPIIMRSIGQEVHYNMGATDIDGDDITYKIVTPIGGSYSAPYSKDYPFQCYGNGLVNSLNTNPVSGLNLNVLTGNIAFYPTTQQISVLKVQITTARVINGVYTVTGVTCRDLQIIFYAGNNKTPRLVGAQEMEICAGESKCFTILSRDSDAIDSTFIVVLDSIKGANTSLTDSNLLAKNSSSKFCWQTSLSDGRNEPYYFTLAVKDNKCPVLGINIYRYSVRVKPKVNLTAKIKKLTCSTYDLTFKSNVDLNSSRIINIFNADSTFQQTFTSDSFRITFNKLGKYNIYFQSLLDTCNQVRWQDSIDVSDLDSLRGIHTNDTIICAGSIIALTIKPTNISSTCTYQWYFKNALIGIDDTVYINKPGVYTIKMFSNEVCRNFYEDSIQIDNYSSKLISISSAMNKINYGQYLILKGNGGTQYSWIGDSIINNWGDSILIHPSITTNYMLVGLNSNLCQDTAIAKIDVSALGVSNQNRRIEFNIYPNPAKKYLTIETDEAHNTYYSITNLQGKQLLKGEIFDSKTDIEVEVLASGLYFLKIGNTTLKFIKE